MSERYLHWIELFRQLYQHSPTKEEIDAVAPQHIREEYLNLHPTKSMIVKSTPKVRLKRSFDGRDCLPEPLLKRYHTSDSTLSRNSLLTREEVPPLRRSPRKHPSSSFASSASQRKTQQKNVSLQKPSACRNLTSLLQPNIAKDTQPYGDVVLPEHEIVHAEITQLRRSPRKHASSSSEGFLSPQKPVLLLQPIMFRHLSSLLGSVSDLQNNKENIDPNATMEVIDERSQNNADEKFLEVPGSIIARGKCKQAFSNEKVDVEKKMRKKNENYRRLKMKRSYSRGTSNAKKKYKKWRKNRTKQ